jgi:riboflavin synthase
MFTGIIEHVGVVKELRRMGAGAVLSADIGSVAVGAKTGDSVAVSGVCLTVSGLSVSTAYFDVSHETLERTTIGLLRAGSQVNVELAMRADGRFGGHIVQGHVDGTGTLARVVQRGEFYDVSFRAGPALLGEMVVKGSVAVDGISLTVAEIDHEGFRAAVIPVTWQSTTLGKIKAGDAVNIETDILVKIVKKQLGNIAGEGLTVEKLLENGF